MTLVTYQPKIYNVTLIIGLMSVIIPHIWLSLAGGHQVVVIANGKAAFEA